MKTRIDIADALQKMAVGETREFKKPTVAAACITKYGADEFRGLAGHLPTSYPNTVRMLRSMGIEYVEGA